jgi:hypothetical protein
MKIPVKKSAAVKRGTVKKKGKLRKEKAWLRVKRNCRPRQLATWQTTRYRTRKRVWVAILVQLVFGTGPTGIVRRLAPAARRTLQEVSGAEPIPAVLVATGRVVQRARF